MCISVNDHKDSTHVAITHVKEENIVKLQKFPSAPLNHNPVFLLKGNPLFWPLPL